MPTPYQPPPNQPLEILYQDDALIAVDKPSGLLSVPGRGADKQDCLLQRLRQQWPSALVVHRLDMGTSGIMIFALHAQAQRELSALFAKREVEKRYLALVRGRPDPSEGDIDLPLVADWPRRPRQKVDFDSGKAAHTYYRTIEARADANLSRLALTPTTGRSHQLRVHLAELGHPILGDELYADQRTRAMSERLMLHAERLSFEHPGQGTRLNLQSAAPF